MEYRNYIFDLYGTLVDIHTDEGRPEFWQKMAGWYESYGADWAGEELQRAYLAMVREEEEKLGALNGSAYPEIQLEIVFLRLLKEAPARHRAAGTGASSRSGSFRAGNAWIQATATMFRVLSRDRLRCFDGVPEMLRGLKNQAKRVFLLSNAQRIFTVPEMEQCGIADCFEGIYISSDRGIKKPEPRFLLQLMEEHELAPAETVMIGNDPDTDMAVAHACGVDGILVSSDGSDLLRLLP